MKAAEHSMNAAARKPGLDTKAMDMPGTACLPNMIRRISGSQFEKKLARACNLRQHALQDLCPAL